MKTTYFLPAAPLASIPVLLPFNRKKANTDSLSPVRENREDGWWGVGRAAEEEREKEIYREGDRGIDRDQRGRVRDKWGKETERGRGQERHSHGEVGKRRGEEGKEKASLVEGPEYASY